MPGKAHIRIPFGRMPDPRRVHGAWIYLFASIAAGAMVGSEQALVPALLAGTSFAGLFLIASVLAIGWQRGRRVFAIGLSLSLLAPALAIAMGSEPGFLTISLLAVAPAVAALLLALRHGWLAPSALVCGVFALTLSSSSAALAGGATPAVAASLFAMLLLFFVWRTLRIAYALAPGSRIEKLDGAALRAQGLHEAKLTLMWTAVTVVTVLQLSGR